MRVTIEPLPVLEEREEKRIKIVVERVFEETIVVNTVIHEDDFSSTFDILFDTMKGQVLKYISNDNRPDTT